MKRKILVIVGPTASGKSALAVSLARKFKGEIISADSRQIYRGLNIGTGKITKREMRGVRHHLLDVASPKRELTAHDFAEKGREAIRAIHRTNKLPIIVGGTGFYIDALLGRVALPNVAPNKKLRARLERKTAAQLFALLRKKDRARAATIEPHNKRRLIRALEIVASFGRVPLHRGAPDRSSTKRDAQKRLRQYDALWLGMTLQSKAINKKIRKRLSARMRRGMIAEAKRLHEAGLSYKRMEGLGLEYRALARYLKGEIRRDEMIRALERDIRHFAKRQRTYWKRNKEINWFAPKERTQIRKRVRNFLK